MYVCVHMAFCKCHTDWVSEVWNHGFIDAPLMPAHLRDGLLDNLDISNKLAELHDLLLPCALNQQHPSAQRKHRS